ncbi:MAG: hypothetical protein AAF191_08765 [Verrucomicrobiota bacterium]
MLLVNGEEFVAESRYMSGDGWTFLFSGKRGGAWDGIAILRRVSLDRESGVVSYLEQFENMGRDARELKVEIRTHFNGYYDRFQSDQGRQGPVRLLPNERGILVHPTPAGKGRDPLVGYAMGLVGDEGVENRPVLGAQRKYVVGCHYLLSLEGGERKSVLHTMVQRPAERLSRGNLPPNFDPQMAVGRLPMELRGSIVNLLEPQLGTEDTWPPMPQKPQGYEGDAPAIETVDGDRLRGSLGEGSLSIIHEFGPGTVAAGEISCLDRTPSGWKIWFGGGKMMEGEVRGSLVWKRLDGSRLTIPCENVRWYWEGAPRSAEMGKELWGEWEQGRMPVNPMEVGSRWETLRGEIQTSASEWVSWERERADGWGWLQFRSGTTIFAKSIDGRLHGVGGLSEFRVPVSSISLMKRDSAADGGSRRRDWWIVTDAGERFRYAGTEAFELETSLGLLSAHSEDVLEIRENEEGGWIFSLKDGSIIRGQLSGTGLTVWDGLRTWTLTNSSIKQWQRGEGTVKREEVQVVIQGLRSEEWSDRQMAREQLEELGKEAFPFLQEAWKEANADEVDFRHQIELLLERGNP